MESSATIADHRQRATAPLIVQLSRILPTAGNALWLSSDVRSNIDETDMEPSAFADGLAS